MMDHDLSDVELRVLGCLIEKERTTPDNYPLSTKALTSACNQKTSRDPVMSVSEADVDSAMLSLRHRGLARSLRPTGSRAWKHRQVTTEILPLSDEELAILGVLMLRGAQTAGELRTRTERMADFESVDDVERALHALSSREPPLTANVGRVPGQSQDRWIHRLAADAPSALTSIAPTSSTGAAPPGATAARRATFRRLHDSTFVMPNPWDRGSARVLQELGFPALATTSAGFGRSIGKDDQEVTRDELVRHVADLAEFVDVPLNVDSERLYPEDSGGISETVRLLAMAGASGCSIEDYNPASGAIDPVEHATEAVREAVVACSQHDIVLTARSENALYGLGNLDDTLARLLSYQDAGADVLYAPGLATAAEIDTIVSGVALPVNVLLWPDGPSVDQLAELGVARVSTGSAFYRAAMATLRERAGAVQLMTRVT